MGNCLSQPKRTLYLILPYSNPSKFKRREELLKQTYSRLKKYSGRDKLVIVVAQLVFEDEKAIEFPHGLVYRTSRRNVLWSKENLINLAIQHLINTKNAEYFAFVDADITFESSSFVKDTLDRLESDSFVQMFETAMLEGPQPFEVTSFAYRFAQKETYKSVANTHADYWHPGFAWAIHRDAFLALGGLIEYTLGSADRHMAMACIGKAQESIPEGLSDDYNHQILNWEQKARKLGVKLTYVPGRVVHHWHGDFKNRKYVERWDILRKYQFKPSVHMKKDKMGVIVWDAEILQEFIDDVCKYFDDRNEDQPMEDCETVVVDHDGNKDKDAAIIAAIILSQDQHPVEQAIQQISDEQVTGAIASLRPPPQDNPLPSIYAGAV